MTKRVAKLILASAVFSLAACGGNGQTTSGGGSTTNEVARQSSVLVAGDWVGNVALDSGTEYLILALRQPGGGSNVSARLYSRAGGFSTSLGGQLDGLSLSLSGDGVSMQLSTDLLGQGLSGSTRHNGVGSSANFERL